MCCVCFFVSCTIATVFFHINFSEIIIPGIIARGMMKMLFGSSLQQISVDVILFVNQEHCYYFFL